MLDREKAKLATSEYLRKRFFRKQSKEHLAGIVPIAAPPLEFNFPWNDAMIPIAPDYLAVERAVYECAMAGCNTIWVVCHMGTQPLLRKRIGDSVRLHDLSYFKLNNEYQAVASVYYVPIHPRDMQIRDSLGWSVLYGANSAYSICKFMSEWLIPGKFYCAFPYGVTDDNFVRQNRALIKEQDKIHFSYNGKTVKDNLHISFTFNKQDYIIARDTVKKYAFDIKNGANKLTSEMKNILKNMTIGDIFKDIDFEHSVELQCPWFYDISTWQGYKTFISSDIKLERNKDYICGIERRKKIIEMNEQ